MPKKPSREPDAHQSCLSIYSSNNELRELLSKLKAKKKLTYRKLLLQMIEGVSASERLLKDVQDYYKSFSETWTDYGALEEIRISLDKRTVALALALAYQLCGKGNLSEVGRLLIRYYADKGDNVENLSSTHSAKTHRNKIVSILRVDKPNIVSTRRHGKPKLATSYTLDVETVSLLGMLVQSMHMKNGELVIYLIEKYAAKEDHVRKLHLNPHWEAQIAAHNTVMKRFNLTKKMGANLKHISFLAMGTENRSAMLRALIRIEADLRGLSVPKRRVTKV